jgi:hypothetical protein
VLSDVVHHTIFTLKFSPLETPNQIKTNFTLFNNGRNLQKRTELSRHNFQMGPVKFVLIWLGVSKGENLRVKNV